MLAVAVAHSPAMQQCGAEAPDGGEWEPFPDADESFPAAGRFATNPRLLLDSGALEMMTLWSLYRSGHLPDGGGSLDQACVMLDAFSVMETAAARLRKA